MLLKGVVSSSDEFSGESLFMNENLERAPLSYNIFPGFNLF